jgi:hypothetical protein
MAAAALWFVMSDLKPWLSSRHARWGSLLRMGSVLANHVWLLHHRNMGRWVPVLRVGCWGMVPPVISAVTLVSYLLAHLSHAMLDI